VRAGLLRPRLTPDRAIRGCREIHRHSDLHLPLWTGAYCDRCVRAVIAITKKRFRRRDWRCRVRQQACLRNDRASGRRLRGNRRYALGRPKGFGNHGVIPSGRLLNPALETFLRRHPAPTTSFYPRPCDASRRRTLLTPERCNRAR
jgi:hypothetical protein